EQGTRCVSETYFGRRRSAMAKADSKIESKGSNLRGRFYNLNTRTKLTSSFGLVSLIILIMSSVGVLTLRQLSSQSQTVYTDYTVMLAEFADMGTALTTHHQILTSMATISRQSDFAAEVPRLPQYRAKVKKILADYEATPFRVSRSGRDEAKDFA